MNNKTLSSWLLCSYFGSLEQNSCIITIMILSYYLGSYKMFRSSTTGTLTKYQNTYLSSRFFPPHLRTIFIAFRERGREREKYWFERETLTGCLSCTPQPGANPQPRHVPWPGIELRTFHFAEGRPANWATPVRDCYLVRDPEPEISSVATPRFLILTNHVQ